MPKLNFKQVSYLVLITIIILVSSQKKIFTKDISSPIDKIEFTGKIIEDKDISAIGFVGKYLIIGADEGNTIQVLEPNKNRSRYQVVENIELPTVKKSKREIDIEGIAVSGNTVYVVGSHSSTKKVTAKTNKKNNRKKVFRFKLNSDTGKLESSIKQESLQAILEEDQVMSQFANIKHQKNGVDIEGIAVKADQLYFGFRTPVLQHNYVPVVVVKFKDIDQTDKYDLRYVNLGGNGIRDLVAVDDGFLLLVDTAGGNDLDYQVYFWDGSDHSSGVDTVSTIELLQKIPTKKNTRAEGLTILRETALNYQVLVVYDGVAGGNPTVFEIPKTARVPL